MLIVVTVLGTAALTWLVWRHSDIRSGDTEARAAVNADVDPLRELPVSGLLVSEEILQYAKSGSVSVWDVLEQAAVPIAVEYFPLSESKIARYRTVPINAAAQQSISHIVKALNPKEPTLYRAVLPKGAELVQAVGQTGFRGFSRTGGTTTHAVLKPVAAGGAIAASWPIFAVAGTVMAIDIVAQRELRAHQRRVETILGRQEERHYVERIKEQRSADAQLTRAISLILDGRKPDLELALKCAYDEFYRSQQFLEKYSLAIAELSEPDGKIDYRRLEQVLGVEDNDHDFFWQLHMARGAIAIRRKAIAADAADAAAAALADPHNAYRALRTFLDSQVLQLNEAERAARDLTQRLAGIELKGGWSIPKAARKQERIRGLAAKPPEENDAEILFLSTASGEIDRHAGPLVERMLGALEGLRSRVG